MRTLQLVRERTCQPRGGSNVHTFIPVLRERLEAENAQLRRSVVDLMLKMQALRDALGHPQSAVQPKASIGPRADGCDPVLTDGPGAAEWRAQNS